MRADICSQKRYFYFPFLLLFFSFIYGCSTRHISPRVSDFSEATVLISKNVDHVFKALKKRELENLAVRMSRSEQIKPDDFLPKIMTSKRIADRNALTQYLINYTRLLEALFNKDYRKSITKRTDLVMENIQSIHVNKNGWLSKNEYGILASLVQAIPETITYYKRKKQGLSIMVRTQKILIRVEALLKSELESVRSLMAQYFNKAFMDQVAERWPKQKGKRLTLAKKGIRIMNEKVAFNTLVSDLISAVAYIAKTHQALIDSIRKGENAVKSIKELINFAYRINESYKSYYDEG